MKTKSTRADKIKKSSEPFLIDTAKCMKLTHVTSPRFAKVKSARTTYVTEYIKKATTPHSTKYNTIEALGSLGKKEKITPTCTLKRRLY